MLNFDSNMLLVEILICIDLVDKTNFNLKFKNEDQIHIPISIIFIYSPDIYIIFLYSLLFFQQSVLKFSVFNVKHVHTRIYK